MIGKIRSRVSSAHLVAGLALVFAIGGGTALALPGTNSVNSGDVKNGTLRGIDVRNNSLTGADIKETSLNGSAIPGGVAGPQGPPGPAGAGNNNTTRLGTNARTSIAAGGFTLSMTTDAGGSCDELELTNDGADGHWNAENITSGGSDTNNSLAAGASTTAPTGDIFNDDTGEVIAYHDNGSGGASFFTLFDEEGGRCVFSAHALG